MVRRVVRPVRLEIAKVRRSRFIASVLPIRGEADVLERVAALRGEFPEANHHCWAYRLGAEAETFRYNDDGEPSGSAGKPILQRIDGMKLTDTTVIVTRIFGGTKLGVGGLIRAYGAAAGEALAIAKIVELVPMRRVRVTVPIALSRLVESILRAADLTPTDASYGTEVTLSLEIPESTADALLAELRERTAGQVAIDDPAG